MTDIAQGGFPLSAFACELLPRVHRHLNDPGAFGRVAQEAVVAALRHIHPGLHDNRGAGTPDCQSSDSQGSWAWEIKYTNGEGVTLGSRDIEGLRVGGDALEAKSRLIVLDISFPARLWVMDASQFSPGHLLPEAHGYAHQEEEARQLGNALQELLRMVDVDLITSEQEGKALIQAAFARVA
jgi:hypothetical protein